MLYKNPNILHSWLEKVGYMKSGKENQKHHSTQFQTNPIRRRGVKVSQTSESEVRPSERSLLIFQNHQHGEDIKEQQQYCHVRRRMVKSLYSVQS